MDQIETRPALRTPTSNEAEAPLDSRSCLFRFGKFTLDQECSELREQDRSVPIQPLLIDLLVYLIRHRGRVVGRSELLAKVWAVTVEDGALTTAVCAARRAIGDSHTTQWAIKTVPRRGYRFVAPVAETERSASSSPTKSQFTAPLQGPAEAEVARLEAELGVWRERAPEGERSGPFETMGSAKGAEPTRCEGGD